MYTIKKSNEMPKKYDNENCNDEMKFEECELAILRHAVDETDKIQNEKIANSEDVKKEAVITTVATIVGLVGGTLAIAEQIRKWYQEYKQKQSGKKIDKVLIVGRNGRRLLLENATIEEIRQILES